MSPLPRLRRFRDDEDGLVLAEFLIMLPLLIWTFMALFIYWDAFRTINQAQKAAYAVSDLISRQSQIDMTFVNGMQTVTEYLLSNSPDVELRITSVEYDQETDKMYTVFSRSPGNRMPQLTDPDLNTPHFRDRIPVMADNSTVIIVESEVAYEPALNVGIVSQDIGNFIVTRPRYEIKICLVGAPCPSQL
ncbi:MAG: hypothetical protein R3D63_02050 [Paracoccaceae bacterium]